MKNWISCNCSSPVIISYKVNKITKHGKYETIWTVKYEINATNNEKNYGDIDGTSKIFYLSRAHAMGTSEIFYLSRAHAMGTSEIFNLSRVHAMGTSEIFYLSRDVPNRVRT
jgi:hypothetical protein